MARLFAGQQLDKRSRRAAAGVLWKLAGEAMLAVPALLQDDSQSTRTTAAEAVVTLLGLTQIQQ